MHLLRVWRQLGQQSDLLHKCYDLFNKYQSDILKLKMLPCCLLILLRFPGPPCTPELRVEVTLEPECNHPNPFPSGPPPWGWRSQQAVPRQSVGSSWAPVRRITPRFLTPAPPRKPAHPVSTQAWRQNNCVTSFPAPKLQFIRDLLERHGVSSRVHGCKNHSKHLLRTVENPDE